MDDVRPLDGGVEAGAPDAGTACEPGTRLEGDRCVAAGIEPEECAAGFDSDGERGCVAVLPEDACPPGLVAFPGEVRCHELLACGASPWGDVAVDGETEHVDGAYPGADSDGTADKPWRTIQEAVDAAKSGGLVAIAAGTYVEDVATPKPVSIAGRCPALVTIQGAGAPAALLLQGDGSAIRGISVTGPAVGIGIGLARGVAIESVRVHDTGDRGIDIEAGNASASVTLYDALVEGAHDIGVFSFGAELQIERLVARGTLSTGGANGRGIVMRRAPSASIRASVVEQNRDIGVLFSGSAGGMDASVVRDTAPDAGGTSGRGVSVQNDSENGAPSDVSITGCVVERNHDVGIFVQSSRAAVDTTVVRDTFVSDHPDQLGSGLHAQSADVGVEPTELVVARSIARDNRFSALSWFGAAGSMERVVARDTLAAKSGLYGRGLIVAYDDLLALSASTLVRASVIERNLEAGAFVQGSKLTIEASIVRTTSPRAIDGQIGRGIVAQSEPGPGLPAELTITGSIVEDNHEIGVHVEGSIATIRDVIVRGTKARLADGLFGDGIEVSSEDPVPRARAEVYDSRVEGSARAGLSCFSADLVLERTTLSCNGIDLAAQTLHEAYGLDDRGGNTCGCDEIVPCQVYSDAIEPPTPLSD